MNTKDLINLTKKGESQTLEFKQSFAEQEEIFETISAFANTKGGTVLVGVSDEGKVIGTAIGKDTLEKIPQKIKETFDPMVFPSINIEEAEGKNVVAIKVQESYEKPVFFRDAAYKRVGRANHKISASEMRKLAKDSGEKVYWDEQVCKGVALKDIDEEKVRWFLRKAKYERNLNINPETPVNEVFEKLKLTKEGKITNACALLFSKEPRFLQSEVKCIRFSGNEPVKPYIDFQTLESNVFDLIDRAEDFVLRNIKKAIWLIPGKTQREEKYEYPPDAIREAIANAVVHREYESPSKVQVRVFEDYIEIWNPGRLPEGWTVKKIKQKHESIPKNPLLFKQLFWVKYVEDVGGGITDMIDWCTEWEIPNPEFEQTETSFIVTFKKPLTLNDAMKSGMNGRQLKAVEYVEKRGSITNAEYRTLTGAAKWTLTKDLRDLVDKGIFLREGKGKRDIKYVLVFGQKSAKKVPKKVPKKQN